MLTPGSSVTIQMARWFSGRAAQECGGGSSARTPSISPAIRRNLAAAPSAPRTTTGVFSDQNMSKCGSADLSSGARLSQIWNSSMVLGRSVSRSGNISECEIPEPAVSHWVSPWPKRAAAPRESAWSTTPSSTTVTVSNPRCGCWGKPGTVWPWYIDHPSLPEKSCPRDRPAREAAGRMVSPSAGGNSSRWWTANRNGSRPGHWPPSGTTWRMADMVSSWGARVS
ncbi:hypothetical protein BFG51_12190 [Dietzia alimentaria]|nr:hypothetical protein BFG51_12190 [Dietzia alimentaria]